MDLTPKQFEELLCEFCRQDLPPNFTIEHDVKDLGNESGNKRQIDTKIKGRLGVSEILICGEAKNWSDPVGSETIDGLVGKYLSGEIRANKVIVFSNQGFAEPAVTRAKTLGIELIEPVELGKPIQKIPHIVAIGYFGQMIVRISHKSPQQNLMSVDNNAYIILKGSERISFSQNVKRLVARNLQSIRDKDIDTDLSRVKIQDSNVLYELNHKEGYKYNADFDIDVSLKWDYFFEFLPTGVLRHVNSGELKFVNLHGNIMETFNKVLLSPTKGNYENKEDLIKNVIKANPSYTFEMCLVDPDRHKTHPHEPIFELV